MDRNHLSVSTAMLYAHLGTASAPMLVDVRRQDAFDLMTGRSSARSVVLRTKSTAGRGSCPSAGRLWPSAPHI